VVSDVEESIVVRSVLKVDEPDRVVVLVVYDVATKQVVVTKDDVWSMLHNFSLKRSELVAAPLHRELPMELIVHHGVLVVLWNLS